MHTSNISRCFLAEKYLFPKFLDVFSEKNAYFQYFSHFSRRKHREILEVRIFLGENIEKFRKQVFFCEKTSRNIGSMHFSARKLRNISIILIYYLCELRVEISVDKYLPQSG